MKLVAVLMRAAWLSALVTAVALGRFILNPSDNDFLVAVAGIFAGALLWMCAALRYNRELRATALTLETIESEWQAYRSTLNEELRVHTLCTSYAEEAEEHWQRFKGWLSKSRRSAK